MDDETDLPVPDETDPPAAAESDRAALTRERARITREIHDVVTHSLSIIAVQTGAAETLAYTAPETAREHVTAARRTAREALAEMRHLRTVAGDGEDPAQFAPQPSLEGIDDLVAGVRAEGLPVTLRVTGERWPVPAGLDLAGYRIVQEALTEAHRLPGPRAVTVAVHYHEKGIDLAVCGLGSGPVPAHLREGGPVGVRERVRVYGGTLHLDAEGNQFTLRARLPRSGP